VENRVIEMNGLKGKTAIVTGSDKGIGLGIAEELHRQGANVVVSSRSLKDCEKVCQRLGKNCLAIKCDVSKRSEVREMVEKTVKKFGGLDILVNNAGIYPYKSFAELDEGTWQKTMDVNLKGVFYCTQEAVAEMKKGGRVINISSIAAKVGFAQLAHYCASKGGVDGLTRALAIELAPRKITVNSVCPGATETPGTGRISQNKETAKSIPLGRVGKPADIAALVAFLASDEAAYITGQSIAADGGWTTQ